MGNRLNRPIGTGTTGFPVTVGIFGFTPVHADELNLPK